LTVTPTASQRERDQRESKESKRRDLWVRKRKEERKREWLKEQWVLACHLTIKFYKEREKMLPIDERAILTREREREREKERKRERETERVNMCNSSLRARKWSHLVRGKDSHISSHTHWVSDVFRLPEVCLNHPNMANKPIRPNSRKQKYHEIGKEHREIESVRKSKERIELKGKRWAEPNIMREKRNWAFSAVKLRWNNELLTPNTFHVAGVYWSRNEAGNGDRGVEGERERGSNGGREGEERVKEKERERRRREETTRFIQTKSSSWDFQRDLTRILSSNLIHKYDSLWIRCWGLWFL
jgi:hypothetical protein